MICANTVYRDETDDIPLGSDDCIIAVGPVVVTVEVRLVAPRATRLVLKQLVLNRFTGNPEYIFGCSAV